MSRSMRLAAVAGAVATVAGVVVGGGAAGAASVPGYVPVAGSAVPFAGHAAVIGSVPSATRLSVQVWLKPDTAAAGAFATAVSTPGGAQYGHYLSPAAYTASYGPTASATAAVASWLRTQGFTGISNGPGRAYVRATAPASVISSAFRTSLKLYKPPAGVKGSQRALRANSTPVSVPSSLSGRVLGVTGLDNAPVVPLAQTVGQAPAAASSAAASRVTPACSSYYGQHLAAGWPKMFGTTSFPSKICGYHASQLRAAYGANGTNTGRSQTIALVELGLAGNMYQTLQRYAAAMKLPAPSRTRYQELPQGKVGTCAGWDEEEELDVEASYAMAPSAHQLVVGGHSCNNGDSDLQALTDADVAVINGTGSRPLASIVSNSWGNAPEGELQSAQLTSIEHAYLVQAAAEGVGMYFSTGDSSGVEPPASDPYAIAVGGTTLGLGKSNNPLFETGWSTNKFVTSANGRSWVEDGEHGAAGGGASLVWAQPAYQAGVVPAALATPAGDRGVARVIPDISADADPLTGIAVEQYDSLQGYSWTSSGGTSLAAPLVAGIVADAQQGQARTLGFLNPALYRLAGTVALRDVLPLNSATPAAYRGAWCPADSCNDSGTEPVLGAFDTESLAMTDYTGQVARPGYDTMTGLGTPNGQSFITALRTLQE
jgi:subtilase family serine protease